MGLSQHGTCRSMVVTSVSLGHFLSHFYILVYSPLFPFFAERFGLTNAKLGLVMSVGTLGPLFLQILVGRAVDSVGGKWTLVAGLTVTTGGTILVSTADSYLALLSFAGVAGLGQAAFHPADYALLEAASAPETRGKTFSLHTFSGYAGFAVAPVAVGLLAGEYGWRISIAVCGVVGLLYALLLAVKLPPAYRRTSDSTDADGMIDENGARRWGTLFTPSLLALFGFYLLTIVGIKGIQTFGLRFFLTWYELPTSLSNLALTLFFVGTAVGILVGGHLADTHAEGRIIVVALTVAVTGLTVLATSVLVGSVSVVGLLTVVGFAIGTTLPSRDSLVSAISPGSAGSSFELVFTGLALGGLISPAILGTLADATNLGVAFLAIAGCYAAVVASLTWRNRDQGESPKSKDREED